MPKKMFATNYDEKNNKNKKSKNKEKHKKYIRNKENIKNKKIILIPNFFLHTIVGNVTRNIYTKNQRPTGFI